ncbi:MAG TPA: nuclear transport factor 2 family protein [Bryobacteraceae bacterium]|nr:nuclear transport factor 2 family protein [Bryobacteraceae bacterium]
MDNQVAPQTDLKTLAQAYLDAFHAHDMERCLEFFADDATVDFNKTMYKGKEGITEWHKDRFAADLKMLKMSSMTVDGDTVVVDGAVTSKRLAAWRLKSLSGRVTMKFENGKIKYGKLAPRMTNPFNMMREDMGA